jgi:hypothetical protein
MKNFKGTKGKWVFEKNSLGACYILTNDSWKGDFIAIVNPPTLVASQEVTEANALLISKAPEMLEMLEKVCHFIDKNKDQNYMVGLLSRGVPEIKQLIKEATEL